MGIGNKLAPIEVASVLAFQDVTDNPPATATDFVYFRKGDVLYQRTPAGVVSVVGSASNITGVIGLDHGGTGADLSGTTINSALALLTNKVATGASAVAFAVNNLIDLVTGGAKIFSFRSAGTEKAAILGGGGVLAPTVGPNTTQQHTLPAVASGTVLVSGTSALTDDTLALGDATHRLASLGVRVIQSGSQSLLMATNTADSAVTWQVRIQQQQAMVTGGACLVRLETAAQQALGGVGSLQLGCPSLGQADAMCYGEWVTASGTVTAGEIVVHSGAKLVATAAASVGLTTIAGVALTTGTSVPVLVAKRGRVYTNSDAGSTVGQLLRTSGSVAGNAVNGGTAVGSILGRACESSGATVAGKILVDLSLS